METKDWFKLFDETKDTFKWFFDEYFSPEIWAAMLFKRNENNKQGILNIMNKVWFNLPDSKFNIVVMPKGWKEFLNLIEE